MLELGHPNFCACDTCHGLPFESGFIAASEQLHAALALAQAKSRMASTADEAELPACSFADLPPEVLQQVFRAAWTSYGAFSFLALKDRWAVGGADQHSVAPGMPWPSPKHQRHPQCRVRALAVCRGWQAALAGLPIPSLTLRVADGQVVNGWEPPSWPGAAALSLDVSACSLVLENKARSALLAVSWVRRLLETSAGQVGPRRCWHACRAALVLRLVLLPGGRTCLPSLPGAPKDRDV